MTSPAITRHGQTLLAHVRWMVRLRWLAGLAIVVLMLADQYGSNTLDAPTWLPAVGLLVLTYNLVLWRAARGQVAGYRQVQLLAYLQIVLDLTCLTVLVVQTGGLASPLLGFYVLHMVFASLLLSRAAAYGSAALAIAMLLAGLAGTGETPAGGTEGWVAVSWAMTLVLTVHLANHISGGLRRHRQRLIVRNRRIRQLVRRLRRQQEGLIQHEKAAAIGRMAAGVAHEIANPLASMDSVLQLMQRDDQRLTQANVDVLRQQVQRIKQTLSQLTDFAHPTEYTWETVQVNDLIEQGLQMVRFDHRMRQIELVYEPAPVFCPIRVQPHAVQQALTNILFNAIDALGQTPSPKLIVRAVAAAEGACIEVIDNGPGIPSEHLSRIFDPFFTTKPVGKGTGLGLAITQTLMRNQGGRVEVQADPSGTRFRLVFPCEAGGPAPAPADTAGR